MIIKGSRHVRVRGEDYCRQAAEVTVKRKTNTQCLISAIVDLVSESNLENF